MKPTRMAGSCGRSLTHCLKLLEGAYTRAGGAGGASGVSISAGAGAGVVSVELANADAGAVAANESWAKELHQYEYSS